MDAQGSVFCHPRILLIWVRRCSVTFRSVSLNITREVCSYLEDFPSLMDVLPDKVMVYRPVTGLWELAFEYKEYLEITYFTGIVGVGGGRLLLSGGLTFLGTLYTALASTYLVTPQRAERLLDMLTCRYGHGLVHYSDDNSVYAFGGSMGSNRRLRTAEKCDLAGKMWTEIPDMKSARMNFSPCVHRSLIYLCGGMNPSIETYLPSTHTYSLLPMKLPEEPVLKWKTSTVITNGCLVVISTSHVWKWNLRADSEPQVVTRSSKSDVWSRCQPMVYGRMMLILDGKGCVRLNMDSGNVVSTRRSSSNESE